jgi:hypothetical protein
MSVIAILQQLSQSEESTLRCYRARPSITG